MEDQSERSEAEGRDYTPHFHLLMFGVTYIDKCLIKALWGRAVGKAHWDYSSASGLPRYPWTRIETPRSKNGCMWYVSKYCAKKDKPEPNSAQEFGPDSAGFIYETKPATGPVATGRVWGVFNRQKLPFAKVLVESVNGLSHLEVSRMRRLVRRFQKSVGSFDGRRGFRFKLSMHSGRVTGFLIYTEDPLSWLRALDYVSGAKVSVGWTNVGSEGVQQCFSS